MKEPRDDKAWNRFYGVVHVLQPSTTKCGLEEMYDETAKPIICLITYCTIFTSKSGLLSLKTGYKELQDGRVTIFY